MNISENVVTGVLFYVCSLIWVNHASYEMCSETLLQYQWVVGPCNVFSIPEGYDRVVQCASGTWSFLFNAITKIRKMSMKALGI